MVCTENRTGRLFAIKKINKRNVMSSKQLKQIKTENRILKKNCHPFVMRLKYSFQSEDHIWFVTEFAHGADLARRLAYLGKFYEYLAKFYTAEAVLALEYLHKRGIIHRDLKLENMLLCKDGHIKITDFGLSKDNMEIDKVSNSVCGTQEYIPPEMILNDYYDYSVDWWAVGISMYRMLCGKPPFQAETHQDLKVKIMTQEIVLPNDLDEDIKSVLKGLLTKDVDVRLGRTPRDAEEVKEHPVFNMFNWNDLAIKKTIPPYVPYLLSDYDTDRFSYVDEFNGPPSYINGDLLQERFQNISFYSVTPFDILNVS